jgi:murein DD-endopeptidase MepM/ murein hydrolase activator NlpD
MIMAGRIHFTFLICLLLISGCTGLQPGISQDALPTSTLAAVPTILALPTLYPSSTPVLNATPTPSDILNLNFPAPAAPPVSKWRAPLNDIPWALSSHDHFYFKRPIAANEVNWPLADYRYGAVLFGVEFIHTGIDIDATRGTPILAAAPGEVVWAGYGLYFGSSNSPNDPYGLAVTIRHNFGYNGKYIYTVYAHMDQVLVQKGQWVNTGDQLGIVGLTGNTTGPHLHFEVRMEENSFFWTRNPELWLAPPQGMGVMVATLRNSNGSYLTGQGVTITNRQTHQRWTVNSYGGTTVRSDDYYDENMVLSDLPAGKYEVSVDYLDNNYFLITEIHPGAITYFTFRGSIGFNTNPPATPSPDDFLNLTPVPTLKSKK